VWQRGRSYIPPPPRAPLLTLLYSIESNMKVLELLRPQWHRPMGDQINASVPQRLTSASVSLAPTPAPALCDAQKALQEVETKRQEEDLAVKESVKEVLA
jgi:GTP cyclohydrolase III